MGEMNRKGGGIIAGRRSCIIVGRKKLGGLGAFTRW